MRNVCFSLLFCSIILIGCTNNEDSNSNGELEDQYASDQSEEENEVEDLHKWWDKEFESYELSDLPRELEQLEEELMIKEGIFSGENYDFEAIKEKLDELPTNSSKEELESAILWLIREDYHEEVEQFVRFDPVVDVHVNKPNEDMDDPALNQASATTHFSILLDASGSMNALSNGEKRIDSAKNAINEFIEMLPVNSTVSLRVYGHKGSGSKEDKQISCDTTEVFYDGEMNKKEFSQALEKVEPAGWTPIAKALEDSEQDFPENAQNAIVYVVSDGMETCEGDPIEAAEQLNAKDIQPIINIIGFQVEEEEKELLTSIAEAGQGTFTYAGTEQDLVKYWNDEYTRMQKAWDEWMDKGMKQADEISNKLMEEADELGNSMMEKSDREFERAERLIEYLLNDRGMENAEHIWVDFYDRSTAIWSYGYDNQTKNWLEAYESGTAAWLFYYDKGTEKWTEYYNKMK